MVYTTHPNPVNQQVNIDQRLTILVMNKVHAWEKDLESLKKFKKKKICI